MSHLLRYPSIGSPTSTVTLRPSDVTVQDFISIQPVQRLLIAADGTQWPFQLSSNRLVRFEVIVEDLREADEGAFSGFLSLYTFFNTVTNWSMLPFYFTHTDLATTLVRIPPETWSFREGHYGYWTGTFSLLKVP